MAYVLWQIQVEDYDRWKAVFDEDLLERGPNGSKGGYVFRNASDNNEVMILLEWDEAKMEQLRQLNQSPRMDEVRDRSGYTAPPKVTILEVTDTPTS